MHISASVTATPRSTFFLVSLAFGLELDVRGTLHTFVVLAQNVAVFLHPVVIQFLPTALYNSAEHTLD